MEKVYQSIIKELPEVRLYFDDLKKIISIFEDENFKNIEIRTKYFRYTKEEFFAANLDVEDQILEISSHDPCFFTLNFGENFDERVRIYASKDTAIVLGIIQKLSLFLKKKKRPVFSVVSSLWFAEIFILIPPFSLFFSKNQDKLTVFLSLFFICGIICLFLIFGLNAGKLFRKNIISSSKKEDGAHFWGFTKKEFINTATTIIGLALAAAAVWATLHGPVVTVNNSQQSSATSSRTN